MPPKGYRMTGPERGWTQDQLTYMRWLCWPQSDKDPQYLTKTGFAALIGVEPDTLRNWERTPGWDEAVEAMGNQVMLELDHLFKRNIAENMLSHKPSDKMVMTYYRYIKPAIERNKPLWEKLVQVKGMTQASAEETRIALTNEIMELPTEQRDVVLAFWRRLIADPAAGDAQVLPDESPAHDFRRQDAALPEARPVKPRANPRAKPLMMLPVLKDLRHVEITDNEDD